MAIPTWELASAEPSTIIPLARARSCPTRPLPAHLLAELTPEFALIVITRPADWAEVRRCLDLAPRTSIDFSRGIIVGLQANVGQRAESGWPLCLRSIRKRSGVARIDATFTPGLYYPTETAPYIELAYVPAVQKVSVVCIDHRTFLIHPATLPKDLEPIRRSGQQTRVPSASWVGKRRVAGG